MDINISKIKNFFMPDRQKNSSSQGISGNEFLKYGNRRPIIQDWAALRMDDSEFYSGYSYAAINNRANKVAQLAEDSLVTDANPAIMEAAKKKKEDVIHPYLDIIDKSPSFTNTQFWYNISTYLDLEGVFYLAAIRTVTPSLTGDIQEFVLLNPYNVRPVRSKDTLELAGYVESVNGYEREWDKRMIIEIKKLNPFSADKPFSMTDAAKDSQFVLKQAGDFTRSSLKNNMSAPGIVTTDVLLEREEFENFKSRIMNQEKGMPIFANGSGAVSFDAMQIELDKAALKDINEINRSQLFAVSGVSKTTMGIEESGTTREVSKTQKDKFIEDHIMPQLQLILDALNQDYKIVYPKEYERTKYVLKLDNPLGSDKDVEIKEQELSKKSYELYDKLVADGYSRDIAAKYAQGEITLEELGEPTEERRPNPVVEAAMMKAGQLSEQETKTPKQAIKDEAIKEAKKDQPQEDKKKIEAPNHFHDSEVNLKKVVKTMNKALTASEKTMLTQQESQIKNAIKKVEQELFAELLSNLGKQKNALSEDDLFDRKDEKVSEAELKNIIEGFYLAIFPIYANELMKKRQSEFETIVPFNMTQEIKEYIKVNARNASESHINTIVNDLIISANKALQRVSEGQVERLIREKNPKLTPEELKAAVSKEIRENTAIYKRAQELALQGRGREEIARQLRNEFDTLSKNRSKTIARTETNRAFTQAQYQADLQFLRNSGLLSRAYKKWETRSDNPCNYCQALANEGPKLFSENFRNIGDTITAEFEDSKGIKTVKSMKVNYEVLEAGNAHVNCSCIYILVMQDESGDFIYNSNDVNKYIKEHSEVIIK